MQRYLVDGVRVKDIKQFIGKDCDLIIETERVGGGAEDGN